MSSNEHLQNWLLKLKKNSKIWTICKNNQNTNVKINKNKIKIKINIEIVWHQYTIFRVVAHRTQMVKCLAHSEESMNVCAFV